MWEGIREEWQEWNEWMERVERVSNWWRVLSLVGKKLRGIESGECAYGRDKWWLASPMAFTDLFA